MKWDSVEIEINLKLGNDAFKCFTCETKGDAIRFIMQKENISN